MKTTKTLLNLFLLLIITHSLSASNGLQITDPQQTWHRIQGTIDEATISVQPKGLYTEIGLYLTFSAQGWRYQADDLLEIVLNFDLPENSIVHDSWLWIEDDIIRASILDKWTAAEIYEDIVNRRKDPSILYKRGQNNYQLRIYPMKASESRKVKITYLVPTNWNKNNISSLLPIQLLKTSRTQIPNIELITWPDSQWKNPKILEYPNITFQERSDSIFGKFMLGHLPSDAIVNSAIHFSFDSPMKNGVYVNTFNNGYENFYQMAFIPSSVLDISTPTKQAFLVDHDNLNSDMTAEQILTNIKSSIYANLTSTDSFNVILSNFLIHRVSNSWLPADSATIERVFAELEPTDLSLYSNMPSLLANGIDFIKQNDFKASIILISSSSQVGEFQSANRLIDDIIALSESKIPIHVVDFQQKNKRSYFIGGKRYLGNGYFYSNISRITSGNYFLTPFNSSLSSTIEQALSATGGFIGSFDLHTSLENGYCYSRFNIGTLKNSTYLDRPILQVGKFNGTAPFIIEVSGVYQNTIFSDKIKIDLGDIYTADSLLEEAWVGNYIQDLEAQNQSNDVVNEIIDYSIDERVLSIYTAFLCLEPSQGGEVCYDCFDETKVTGTDDNENESKQDSVINAFPNPFRDQLTIDISLPKNIDISDVSFTIYNIMGKAIHAFEKPDKNAKNKYQLKWNSHTSSGQKLASGQYLFMINTPKERYVKKLIHLE